MKATSMSNPALNDTPLKTCDYCGAQGRMPTFMDGETICMPCMGTLPRDLSSARKLVVQLQKQLVEAHAREAQLRDALTYYTDPSRWKEYITYEMNPYDRTVTCHPEKTVAEQALALPHDDTALKARLKAERERCAKAFSQQNHDGRWAARVIRNLGDE